MAYIDLYENFKDQRLSEYAYVGVNNTWATPELAQYGDKPETWGEALKNGKVILGDIYENSRTRITVSYGGDSKIKLEYAQKTVIKI